MAKNKGTITDHVSFIDESFLVNFSPNTWWIDSGATMHISNSLQVFSSIRNIREGERSLRVADGNEVKVEALGASIWSYQAASTLVCMMFFMFPV